jgi:glutamate dehydrogenase
MHPLRRQIISTVIVNDVVERGGLSFVFRAVEDTGAGPADVVRAYAVAQEVFDLPGLWARAEELAPPAQIAVLLESKRLLDRSVRWLLQGRRSSIDVDRETARLRPGVAGLVPQIPELLVGVEAERWQTRAQRFAEAGAPPALAQTAAGLLDAFALLHVVEMADTTGRDAIDVAELYFALSVRFQGAELLGAIAQLPRADRWQALARSALRDDLYAALASLTGDVLRASAMRGAPAEATAQEAIDLWARDEAEALAKVSALITDVLDTPSPDTAQSALSVALRNLRGLVATSRS